MRNQFNALILCGGEGTRLEKLGKKIPKSLLKLNKNPVLFEIINSIPEQCKQILISGHYLFDKIEKYIKKEFRKNKRINFFDDGKISIIARIKKNLIRGENNLIVFYGDELADINFDRLIRSHNKSKKLITICTYKHFSSFGFLKKKSKNKFTFSEKPYIGNYNIGFLIFEHKNLKFIKNYNKLENYINFLCSKDQVNEYIHDGYHITFNSVLELELARKNIKKINEKR